MAAAPIATNQLKEDFLTCSICSEPYDNDEHTAKCLPCLHTYCKSCLQKKAGRRSKINCPNCCKFVTLLDGTVDSLPNKFLADNLKEYQRIFNQAAHCGNCDNENPVVRFCRDCSSFQCQNCVHNHMKMRSTRDHQLVTMEELQTKKCNPMMQQQPLCTKHSKQDMTMYCREAGCRVPVCSTCVLLDHRGHDLIELSAAVDGIVTDVQQSSARVNQRNQELERIRSVVEEQRQTLTSNFKQKQKEVQDITQKLCTHINTNCKKAEARLKEMFEAEMTELTVTMETVDPLAAQMTSACEFANQSCNTANPTQILTLQNQIQESLNELQVIQLPDTRSHNKHFVLTRKHKSAMDQIHEAMQDLYDVSFRKLQIDPEQCTIQFTKPPAGDARQKEAILQTVECNGDKVIINSANIEATQGGNSLHVQDNNNGTYRFQFDAHKNSEQLHVKINGSVMRRSPFNTVCQVVDPQKCTIQLGLPLGLNLKLAIVQLVASDGCLMNYGDAQVEATQGGVKRHAQNNNDGTYKIKCEYLGGSLQVKINGTPMRGSPFSI